MHLHLAHLPGVGGTLRQPGARCVRLSGCRRSRRFVELDRDVDACAHCRPVPARRFESPRRSGADRLARERLLTIDGACAGHMTGGVDHHFEQDRLVAASAGRVARCNRCRRFRRRNGAVVGDGGGWSREGRETKARHDGVSCRSHAPRRGARSLRTHRAYSHSEAVAFTRGGLFLSLSSEGSRPLVRTWTR